MEPLRFHNSGNLAAVGRGCRRGAPGAFDAAAGRLDSAEVGSICFRRASISWLWSSIWCLFLSARLSCSSNLARSRVDNKMSKNNSAVQGNLKT
ncbi:unnamed protein product [Urochloa humidicola]